MKRVFKTKIIDLIYFDCFNDAISNLPFELIADKDDNKESILKDLNIIYSKEKQDKYGVLAIKLELLN